MKKNFYFFPLSILTSSSLFLSCGNHKKSCNEAYTHLQYLSEARSELSSNLKRSLTVDGWVDSCVNLSKKSKLFLLEANKIDNHAEHLNSNVECSDADTVEYQECSGGWEQAQFFTPENSYFVENDNFDFLDFVSTWAPLAHAAQGPATHVPPANEGKNPDGSPQRPDTPRPNTPEQPTPNPTRPSTPSDDPRPVDPTTGRPSEPTAPTPRPNPPTPHLPTPKPNEPEFKPNDPAQPNPSRPTTPTPGGPDRPTTPPSTIPPSRPDTPRPEQPQRPDRPDTPRPTQPERPADPTHPQQPNRPQPERPTQPDRPGQQDTPRPDRPDTPRPDNQPNSPRPSRPRPDGSEPTAPDNRPRPSRPAPEVPPSRPDTPRPEKPEQPRPQTRPGNSPTGRPLEPEEPNKPETPPSKPSKPEGKPVPTGKPAKPAPYGKPAKQDTGRPTRPYKQDAKGTIHWKFSASANAYVAWNWKLNASARSCRKETVRYCSGFKASSTVDARALRNIAGQLRQVAYGINETCRAAVQGSKNSDLQAEALLTINSEASATIKQIESLHFSGSALYKNNCR